MILFLSLLVIISIFCNSCAHSKGVARDILPRESFIFVNKVLTLYKCIEDRCVSFNYKSAASAFVVKIEGEGAYAVTAGHVCDDRVPKELQPVRIKSKYVVQRLDGTKYSASVLTYDMKIDTCLLFIKGLSNFSLLNAGAKAVKMSSDAPEPGDRIYNIAAPQAIYRPNMVPILEGRFNGNSDGMAWYTLPAAPGSSGSMIINGRGELIGMVHSVFINFPIITLSTEYEDLKHFINTNVSKFSAYKMFMKMLGFKDHFHS